MRPLAIVVAAAALGLSSAFLVACGDRPSGLIPASQASVLNDDLDKVSSDVSAQECKRAQAEAADGLAHVNDLPAQLDARLRERLTEGFNHVRDRVVAECGKQDTTTSTTPTETTPTQAPTTTETPTPTATTPTPEPTTPSPRPTPTTPPSPSPPSDGGGSGGTPPSGGNGGSGGSGGSGGGNGTGGTG